MERILEMFEKFDAEGMMHTYALHGYYQVISDMKDLGYDSDRSWETPHFRFGQLLQTPCSRSYSV